MEFLIHWTWFVAVLCILIEGDVVWCDCSLHRMEIESGNFSLSNGQKAGSLLRYECHVGFYPYPELAYRCQLNGHWTPEPVSRARCKVVECPDPTVLQNGYTLPTPENRRYYYQSKITYHCYSGYTLNGPFRRTCLENGKWSGSNPVCQQESGDCRDPGVPPGGMRSGNSFEIGDKVTFTCRRNMILIGSEERKCQPDRHWSGKETHCYYKYTFDSPWEVTEAFGGEIKNTLSSNLVNKTQKGLSIKLTRNGTLNIFIALDISESINDDDLENAKQAVKTLIQKIEGFTVYPNYEVIFFSSKIQIAIDILEFYGTTKPPTLSILLDKFEKFKVKENDKIGTNIDAVFDEILEKMSIIKTRVSSFSEHQHVIILFTDGGYNTGGSPTGTLDRIKSMVYMDQPEERKEHLEIYVFGIGAQIHDDNLRLLTADSNKNYFKLNNLKDLQTTFDNIIDESEVRGLCGLYQKYAEEDIEGVSNNDIVKIKRKRYPWIVFITVVINGEPKKCLGSLVSRRFILTAAHCFKDKTSVTTVEVTDGPQMGVQEIHIHPNYNLRAKVDQGVQEFYDYDVALIELVVDVPITISLRPICIPCTAETNAALRETLTCREQENFLLKNHEQVSFMTKDKLQEKVARVKMGGSRHNCVTKAQNANITVTENFLCTGGHSPFVDHIACKGESGGAVFKDYKSRTFQVAVVSWGTTQIPACEDDKLVNSEANSRDFHINLFKVVPFLKSILGNQKQNIFAPLLFVD